MNLPEFLRSLRSFAANLSAHVDPPNLSASVTRAGVLIPWKFDGYSKWVDVLRIEVDRSDGKGFVHLTYDTTPGYTDTHPQPATLT